MRCTRFNSQSGKSVIELTIVLVVASILVAFAVARIGNAQSNLQRQNLAREFKNNLERARFDSVKRRADLPDQMARLVLTSANSYTVLTDFNQNGTIETNERRLINFSGRTNVRILGSDLVFPVTVRFDRLGNVAAVNADGAVVRPNFTFCEGTCTLLSANQANSSLISISNTGTVAMLDGGSAVPTFGAPAVSAVGSGNGINQWMIVRDNNYEPITPTPTPGGTGTPLPTVTPTPVISPTPLPTQSPTPTATPVNSPTPLPTLTPTPTPSIRYCTSGQRPAATGCTCRLPMTVRSSGKCI